MPSQMDQVADKNGVELARFAATYEFPDFVKRASLDATLNPSDVAASHYGDPRTRQFPCHTAPSTWLSALYFQEKKAEFHPKDQARILTRIDEHAQYFRIKASVDAMRARWGELHKTAEEKLPDSAYAWVWHGDNGTKDRRLPIRNGMEVKVAAEWLQEHRDKLPFGDRHVIAGKILQKASQYGVGLGKQAEFLDRQAGRGVCDPAEVVAMIKGRAALVKEAGLKAAFTKMAASVAEAPKLALQPQMLVKLAETVDKLDRDLNLAGRYSDAFPRPEDVVFKVSFTKAASDVTASTATTSGKVYEKQAFGRLAVEDVRAMFGDDFVERVTTPLGRIDPEKMAEEVSTLPRPDAEMLDSLMSDSGVAPLLSKAASVPYGFDEAEMKGWAGQYRPIG